MCPCLPLESGCSSFIAQPSNKRPNQTGVSELLPDELIVLIGKSIDTPASNNRRSLALFPAGFPNVIRPLHYQAHD
ncbi:hypothetical protein BFJ63_vAg6056 [Fusarium oxysporum f. sp. narcissi]|uniref:Uncharacterized protein n=3 Tax=Fusarium oxysporum TaxID=5507 RepID=A0A420QUV2_FUSOX|nr:hypothetical protein BFJ65_g1534 [Fusarium oxysporum f. sp. cepae]RKL08525.1 hypothetical protein BFJ71_g1812 [Fusarium oxysporum]RYC91206.1 hypothetical protein BFJ63_vAg6056 [Fusarium oxysporum f. sp. narcissi]RKK50858.1 hypothetical protein BFJ66_g6344 [Fusarium oxysporum f. sp. cepae]RKK59411.1 hypothetical protein BFJ67_g2524 [Fusarium oxysporum f. sp. cepae]